MLKYQDKSLVDLESFEELRQLQLFRTNTLYRVWRNYLRIANNTGRVVGNPMWNRGLDSISVIGIRQNPEISFNLPPTYYNDVLMLLHFTSRGVEVYAFRCTMDPGKMKHGVAHLLEGVYNSYMTTRPHAWIPGRAAIVQDRGMVHVGRTDSSGQLIRQEAYLGMFGINIHDAGRFQNSSLGCTVLEPDSLQNDYHYEAVFKPLLKGVSNKHSIDYMVTNTDIVRALLLSNYRETFAELVAKDYVFTIS